MGCSYNRSKLITCLRFCVAFFTLTLILSLNPPNATAEQASSGTIGGKFIMKDHTGIIVMDEKYRETFMLISFGYTTCPDVCPTALTNMANVMDELADDSKIVTPIFITIDPKRDTVSRIRDYVTAFHPRMVGLTGSQTMTDRLIQSYNLEVKIHEPEGNDPMDYLVDHTASMFLMAPDGTFLVKFAYAMDSKEMAKRIRDFM